MRDRVGNRDVLSTRVLEMLRQWERVVEREGVLYQKRESPREGPQEQIIMPRALQKEVLMQMHGGHVHQGIWRTFKWVSGRRYWSGMYCDVEDFCKSCERCIVSRAPQPRVVTAMGSLLASKTGCGGHGFHSFGAVVTWERECFNLNRRFYEVYSGSPDS